ncbi:hypothetical protein H9P43_002107 [Blastocladiella emersonii ATCC 22665]|nr:hypothetical protein H9P43_002107 [Blastocladiella emersonii ATCC 22665]
MLSNLSSILARHHVAATTSAAALAVARSAGFRSMAAAVPMPRSFSTAPISLFERNDRPRRDFGNRDDRPRRDFGGDREDRPRRDFWNRDGGNTNNRTEGYRSGGDRGFERREPRAFVPQQKAIGEFDSFKSPFEYTPTPDTAWGSVDDLVRPVRRALAEDFGYEMCTPVQAAIAQRMPLDKDLVVQAKTGTGKTLAFLVPAVNRAIQNGIDKTGRTARVLVISPTRELALQIGAEAKKLVFKARMDVHTLVGGESKLRQSRDLTRRRTDIIVGTPGRLLDMIKSDAKMRDILKGVETLVLDEADRMLEIGFKDDIEEIVKYINRDRQTLLFSATYPSNVSALVDSTLKPGYEVVNTISPDDVSTVHLVKQSQAVVPLKQQPHLLYSVLARAFAAESRNHEFKAIVFFPTTRSVELYTQLFRNLASLALPDPMGAIDARHIFEIHSRKSQDQRVKISDRFRRAKSGILFTSDVSARGVDYPGINLVVQMGMPTSPDQYVHRIGRTGRAGREGAALLVLAPFERAFLNGLAELPLEQVAVNNHVVATGFGDKIEWDVEAATGAVRQAANMLDQTMLEDLYLGNLGFYQGQMDTVKAAGIHGHEVRHDMEGFVTSLGLDHVPNLPQALRGSFSEPRSNQRGGSNGFRRPAFGGSGSSHRTSSGGFNRPNRTQFSPRQHDGKPARSTFERREARPSASRSVTWDE